MGRKFTKNPARPVTFSLRDSDIEALHERCDMGVIFISRSEWLRRALSGPQSIGEMSTAQIMAYLLNNRPEIKDQINDTLMIRIIQNLRDVQ